MYTANHPRRRQAEAALGFGCPFFASSAAPGFGDASLSNHAQPWGNAGALHEPPDNVAASPFDWMESGQDISNSNPAYSQPSALPNFQTDKPRRTGHVISANTAVLSIGPEFSFDDWLFADSKVQPGQEILSDKWEVNHAAKIAPLETGLDLSVDFGVAIQPMPMKTPFLGDNISGPSLPSTSVPQMTPVNTISDVALRPETKRKSKSCKKQRLELHHQSKAEKEPLFGRYRFRIDSDAPTQPEYSRTVSGPDRQHQKALKEQGGGCIRCQIGHKKCDTIGGGPCEPCLEFWNNNLLSRTIVWTGCIRSKLVDVSPYANLQKDCPQKYESTWKLIESNHFYDLMKANAPPGLGQLHERQLTDTAFDGAPTHIHQVTREQKHCVFTRSGAGLDFYYAMLAIHTVEYDGCEFEFLAVINTAGQRALEALDILVDLRRFAAALLEQKYGLLVCLFYGLMTMIRLRNRAVRARRSQFVFQEYKSLDVFRLQETARILGHYFVLVCERLEVPQEDWYGKNGMRPSAEGFKFVRGLRG